MQSSPLRGRHRCLMAALSAMGGLAAVGVPAAHAANTTITIPAGSAGNFSALAVTLTAGDILQDSALSAPAAFTLTVDQDLVLGTLKLNNSGNHTGTFNADGTHFITLNNTGGTISNIFGTTNASIGQNANAGSLTVAAPIILANAMADIGSTQVGTVTIAGAITASTATTLNLRQNATQTSTTITDSISGSIGATGSAIAINNLSSGGGGNTKDIFAISGAIGGAIGTGAAVTITNAATGTSPFNVSGILGATVSSITQNSSLSTMTISGANSNFAGATSVQAGTLSLGSSTALGSSALTLNNTSGATLNLISSTTIGSLAGGGTSGGNVTLGALTLSTGNNNANAAYAGAISGTGGVTKIGTATQTLTGTNTYTGTTAVNSGTLKLDFTVAGVPAANIVGNTTSGALALGGGALQIVGADAVNSQVFSGTTLNAGGNSILVTSGAAGSATLALGTISRNAGSTVVFALPAAGSVSTSAGTASTLLTSTGGATYALIADVSGNIVDFAARDSGGINIGAGASVASAAYSSPTTSGSQDFSGAWATPVMDFINNGNTGIRVSATAGVSVTGVRFNASRSGDWTINTSTLGRILNTGGILVTTNVGAFNVNVSGPGLIRQATSGGDMILAQDNTAGYLNISSAVTTGSGTSATGLVKTGRGTLVLGGVNTYTGQTYLNGGSTLITASSGVGGGATPTSLANLNLNGGTLVGNAAAVSTDFSSSILRLVFLNTAGGGLASTSGNTLTVGGLVTGSGPLAVGTGAIAGSGSAGNAALTGSGTVALSNINSTFDGTVNVNNGVLSLTAGNAGGTGATSVLGNTNVARSININSGGTLRFDNGDILTGNGTTPTATLVINAGGTVTNNGASFNTLGAVNLNGGTLTGTGGT
ncbi:MAG: Extracellular serine protease precursor, partial [Phycisphaerales bacterium]|nr:Extracellular serine protease precursor [Phycisphaerales bacterium]